MDSIKTTAGLSKRDFKLTIKFGHINWLEDILNKKSFRLNKSIKQLNINKRTSGILDDLYYSLGLNDNP